MNPSILWMCLAAGIISVGNPELTVSEDVEQSVNVVAEVINSLDIDQRQNFIQLLWNHIYAGNAAAPKPSNENSEVRLTV